MAKEKHKLAPPPAAKKAAASKAGAPAAASAGSKAKGKNVEPPPAPAPAAPPASRAAAPSTMLPFSLGEEVLAYYGPYAVVARILEAAVFQVFPRASIEAKEAAANAPSSSDPKKTTEPAEKPALHRYFRIQHVGWERFGTSRWVSELDCRKIYASPDGVATEEERELQRIEFAKDHVRAKTDRELKFDWTDAYADVIIKITEPGVKEEEIEVRVTGERMLDVCFRDRVFKMGTLQSLSLFLAGAVSPKQCSLKLEADRVIVTLRKAKPMLWDKLEGKNPVSGGSQQHRVTRVFAGRKPEEIVSVPTPQPATTGPAGKRKGEAAAASALPTPPLAPSPTPPEPKQPSSPLPPEPPKREETSTPPPPPPKKSVLGGQAGKLAAAKAAAAESKAKAAATKVTTPPSGAAGNVEKLATPKPMPKPEPAPKPVVAPKPVPTALAPKPLDSPISKKKKGVVSVSAPPIVEPAPIEPPTPPPEPVVKTTSVAPWANIQRDNSGPSPLAPAPQPLKPAWGRDLPRKFEPPPPPIKEVVAPKKEPPQPPRKEESKKAPARKVMTPELVEHEGQTVGAGSDSDTAEGHYSPRYSSSSGSSTATVEDRSGDRDREQKHFDVSRMFGIGILEPPGGDLVATTEINIEEDPIVAPAFVSANRFGVLPHSPGSRAGVIGSAIHKPQPANPSPTGPAAAHPAIEGPSGLFRQISGGDSSGQKTWAQLAARSQSPSSSNSHFSLFSSSPPTSSSPLAEALLGSGQRKMQTAAPTPPPSFPVLTQTSRVEPVPFGRSQVFQPAFYPANNNTAPGFGRGKRQVVSPVDDEDPAEGLARQCIICYDDSRCVAFIPCGHLASCVFCAPELKGNPCPICRKTVEATLRIFNV